MRRVLVLTIGSTEVYVMADKILRFQQSRVIKHRTKVWMTDGLEFEVEESPKDILVAIENE